MPVWCFPPFNTRNMGITHRLHQSYSLTSPIVSFRWVFLISTIIETKRIFHTNFYYNRNQLPTKWWQLLTNYTHSRHVAHGTHSVISPTLRLIWFSCVLRHDKGWGGMFILPTHQLALNCLYLYSCFLEKWKEKKAVSILTIKDLHIL